MVKLLVPGFDLELSWSIVLPIIFIAFGINNMIKFKKVDIFNIVVKSTGIFGGTENKTNNKHDSKKKTIYINAVSVFGGVDLK